MIVEIRGAEGGEEANLFARDLFEMYQGYAGRMGWKLEVLGSDPSDMGGFNDVTFLLKGDGRVDPHEARGRAAPGAAGAGHREPGPHPHVVGHRHRAARGRGGRGRHRPQRPADRRLPVVGPRRAVREHHRLGRAHHPQAHRASWWPCRTRRARSRTGPRRMLVLRSRLLKLEQDRQAAELSDARKGQVGGGGRSEKIRTYNFKENRVTDHRIGLTLYKLDKVLAGELDEVIDALVADEQTRRLTRSDVTVDATWRDRAVAAPSPRLRAAGRSTAPTRRSAGSSSRPAGSTAAEQTAGLDEPADRAPGATSFDAMVAPAGRRRAAAVRARAAGAFRTLDLLVDRRVLIPRPETGGGGRACAIDARWPRCGGTGRRGRPRHRLGRHRPVARRRALAGRRGVGHRRVGRRPRRGPGQPRRPRPPGRRSVRLAEGDWFDALPDELRGHRRPGRVQPALRGRRRGAAARRWPTGSRPPRCVPGPDGLEAYERIVAEAPRWLRPGGALVLEIGETQGDAVRRPGRRPPASPASTVHPDLAGRPRAVAGSGLTWSGHGPRRPTSTTTTSTTSIAGSRAGATSTQVVEALLAGARGGAADRHRLRPGRPPRRRRPPSSGSST